MPIIFGGLAVLAVAASVGVTWAAARRQVRRVIILHVGVIALHSGAVVLMSYTLGMVASGIVLIEVGLLFVAVVVALVVAVTASAPPPTRPRSEHAEDAAVLARAYRERLAQDQWDERKRR